MPVTFHPVRCNAAPRIALLPAQPRRAKESSPAYLRYMSDLSIAG